MQHCGHHHLQRNQTLRNSYLFLIDVDAVAHYPSTVVTPKHNRLIMFSLLLLLPYSLCLCTSAVFCQLQYTRV